MALMMVYSEKARWSRRFGIHSKLCEHHELFAHGSQKQQASPDHVTSPRLPLSAGKMLDKVTLRNHA